MKADCASQGDGLELSPEAGRAEEGVLVVLLVVGVGLDTPGWPWRPWCRSH